MESTTTDELGGAFRPIVFLRTDTYPSNAISPKEGARRGCVMGFISHVIRDRKTAVFTKETCLCAGAAAGLCFGNSYAASPGGVDTFAAFFSYGLESAKDPETYQKFCDRMPEKSRRKFLEGERMHVDSETAKKFIDDEITAIPEISGKYAVFKPLEDLVEGEVPVSVIFTVNPVELAALMHLAGSLPGGNGLTASSRISACQALGSKVLQESKKEVPNAVLGMTDLAGRGHCRNVIPNEYMTYSVPWNMFLAMEEAAPKSFFQTMTWEKFKE
ncbi:DUF169 domain-containing protein [Methanocorpusculum labreanum]|nr:DUF169 domain-containing protein [Methanocorpusculum labreanum]